MSFFFETIYLQLKGFFFNATKPKTAAPNIPTPVHILFIFSVSIFNFYNFSFEYPNYLQLCIKVRFLESFSYFGE